MAALKALRYMAVCHIKKGGTALIRPLHPRMQRAFLMFDTTVRRRRRL